MEPLLQPQQIRTLKEKFNFSPVLYEQCLEEEAVQLFEEINRELRNLIRPVEGDPKLYYRNYTSYAKDIALEKHQKWLEKNWTKYSHVFAEPTDVVPTAIQPRLELVETQAQRDIFRIARLSWNLPFSAGYGRRLNYLIWDEFNEKLIGILGLQSPPITLPSRDKEFKIPYDIKPEIVNQTMDAYTLGALPPYNDLLAGKLIVLAAASQDIRVAYEKRYEGRRTEILDRVLPSSLVAVTTLSAFGRSSLYNRVSKGFSGKGNVWAAISLGNCGGWGTLHFSDKLYERMKSLYKKLFPDKRTGGFGIGPKIRLQVTSKIISILGLSASLLKHNVAREVFIIPHIENLDVFLSGAAKKPVYNDKPFNELAAFWKERYCLPRSKNRCSIEGRNTIAEALKLQTNQNLLPAENQFTEQPERFCYRCQLEKPLSAFIPRVDDRHYNMCRSCVSEILCLRESKRKTPKLSHTTTHRICYLCRRSLPLNDFTCRSNGSSLSECKACNYHVLQQRRRAKKKAASGSYTRQEWEDLVAQYDHCPMCQRRWVAIPSPSTGAAVITVAHIIPLFRGGANSIDNIQPLCYSCNSEKRSKLL